MSRDHDIRVQFSRGSTSVMTDEVLRYTIRNDMLSVADEFAIELPVRRELWALASPDSRIDIWIDDSQVLSGFVDSRDKDSGTIAVNGRDRGGRLVDEYAPLIKYGGTRLQDLYFELVSPWFENVTLVNTENRALIGGRGRRANAARSEPIYTVGSRELRKQVNPADRIADVMLEIAEQGSFVFWSTADGRDLFVGLPNQEQEATFWFFNSPAGEPAHLESNVRDMRWTDDIAEYYSEIIVVGAGNASTTHRRAFAADGPEPGGLGNLFAHRKRHLIVDQDIRTQLEALERAEREKAELGSHVRKLEIVIAGHGQIVGQATTPTIYHFDSVARAEDTEIDEADDFYITAVLFEGDRDDDQTTITLVPQGTALRVHG